MAMAKVTSSVVLAIVAGLAMVSLAAATTGTATFYTPPYTRALCFLYLLLSLVACYSRRFLDQVNTVPPVEAENMHSLIHRLFISCTHAASKCHGFQEEGTMIGRERSPMERRLAQRPALRGPVHRRNQRGRAAPLRTGRSVTVRIVDLCPPGCSGTIDVSQEAFAVIANPDAGKINIECTRYVLHSPCVNTTLLITSANNTYRLVRRAKIWLHSSAGSEIYISLARRTSASSKDRDRIMGACVTHCWNNSDRMRFDLAACVAGVCVCVG
jgi:hypothetical protein